MNWVVALALLLTLGTSTEAKVSWSRFDRALWFPRAVVVGRVLAVQDTTLDLTVQEWMRDTTGERLPVIRAFRYVKPSCLPEPYADYSIGALYLFLMRKPNDEGAGGNPHWIITDQLLLDGTRLCFRCNHGLLFEKVHEGCEETVEEKDVLDAFRSFDRCLHVAYDRDLGRYLVDTMCSDRTLRKWSERSALHAALAASALRAREEPQK